MSRHASRSNLIVQAKDCEECLIVPIRLIRSYQRTIDDLRHQLGLPPVSATTVSGAAVPDARLAQDAKTAD